MSRDLPILFNPAMVRAILREIEKPGTGKTQTRRILNPQPAEWRARIIDISKPFFCEEEGGWGQAETIWSQWEPKREEWRPLRGLRYAVGDRLWVREAWRVSKSYDAVKPSDLRPRIMTTLYEAGGSLGGVIPAPKTGERTPAEYVPDLYYPMVMPEWAGKRRPGMFMPRWASRITLIVTDVRVQRLQEVSEADAIAEGVWHGGSYERFADDLASTVTGGRWFHGAREWYCDLWGRINGTGSWDANPWVAAYSFRPILGNIDAVQEVQR